MNTRDPAKMILKEDKVLELKVGVVDLFNGRDLSVWSAKGGKILFRNLRLKEMQ